MSRGSNNPAWKGGVSSENNIERHSKKYKKWVDNVFKRDNYTCQACNQVGGTLRAHHINNFAKYIDLRYEVSNGITLCSECHDVNYDGSLHKLYGTKNCTKENLYEFIALRKNK